MHTIRKITFYLAWIFVGLFLLINIIDYAHNNLFLINRGVILTNLQKQDFLPRSFVSTYKEASIYGKYEVDQSSANRFSENIDSYINIDGELFYRIYKISDLKEAKVYKLQMEPYISDIYWRDDAFIEIEEIVYHKEKYPDFSNPFIQFKTDNMAIAFGDLEERKTSCRSFSEFFWNFVAPVWFIPVAILLFLSLFPFSKKIFEIPYVNVVWLLPIWIAVGTFFLIFITPLFIFDKLPNYFGK